MDEDTSPLLKSSFATGPLPSSDGSIIASIHGSKLVFHDSSTHELIRSVQLPVDLASNVTFFTWSRKTPPPRGVEGGQEGSKAEESFRLLVGDDQVVEVFDARDPKWHATVNPGFGGMKYVDFGADENEVLILSSFQLIITAWSLRTSRHVDMQNPKLTRTGFGHRPQSSYFALLARPATHDVLHIYSPTTYNLITSVSLPTTDAQGLKWSPCGRWIAIWDAASAGYRIVVYTADGHLFRTYEQSCVGLGIKTVQWSPGGEYLVIGDYEGKIIFLNNFLFNPVIEMRHTTVMKVLVTDVWSEELSIQGERTYSLITPPVNLPSIDSIPSDPTPKIGVSSISFNADGSWLASKDERMPNSVWIWSMKDLSTSSILVQLSHVKSFQWHPNRNDLLGVVCGADPSNVNTRNSPAVYFWSSQWNYPRVVPVSVDLLAANIYFKWISSGKEFDETEPRCEEDFDGHEELEELDMPTNFVGKKIKYIVGDKERYQIRSLQ